ncbi:diguanylate cyclase [Aquisalimonas sp.]|uniref:sensor domain-containing protein n=1 Tax=Aquisalimonas sp. TaxID=1872621 RepID=UPI0025BF2640|nr:diguanylate cyclase [Aquisalimonas sp.]
MGSGALESESRGGSGGSTDRELPAESLPPLLRWLCHDTAAEGALILQTTNDETRLLGAFNAPLGLQRLMTRLAPLIAAGTEVTTTSDLGLLGPERPLQLLPVPTDSGDVHLCLIAPSQTQATTVPSAKSLAVEALAAHVELLQAGREEARIHTGHVARGELLQETLDGLDEPLCTCDQQGRILAVNLALGRLLDEDRHGLIGRNLTRFLSGDATAFMEHLRARTDAEAPYPGPTWHLLDAHGHDLEVSVKKTVLLREDRPERILLHWRPVERQSATPSLQDARSIILERVTRREPVQATLGSVCELAESQLPETIAIISVPRPEGGRLLIAPDMPPHLRQGLEAHHGFDTDESLCASVVATGERHICPDVRMEDRWPDYRWFAVAHGIHSIWSEPLRSRDGNTLGALTVFRAEAGRPTCEQLDALQRLADLGAVAVSHANFLEELESQAYHDGLTGLPNRRLLSDRLAHQLGLARRSRQPVAVLLLDVDGFKQVNDQLGHHEGDRLLCRLANELGSVLRPGDTLARLGGDEFVVVAALGHSGDAPALAERLLAAAKRLSATNCAGISIGISVFPDHGDSERPLLHRADSAMYQAKEQGKNRWAVYAHSATDQALHPAR